MKFDGVVFVSAKMMSLLLIDDKWLLENDDRFPLGGNITNPGLVLTPS